jgi:flagellar hook-length control protein FliK
MDTISPHSNWAVDKKLTSLDILSTRYLKENVSGKKNRMGKDYMDQDSDPSSPRISFKKTFEETASRKDGMNAVPKMTPDELPEETGTRDTEKSAEVEIPYREGYGEAVYLQNSHQIIQYSKDAKEMTAEELVEASIDGTPENTVKAILNTDPGAINLSPPSDLENLQNAELAGKQVNSGIVPFTAADSSIFSNSGYGVAETKQSPNKSSSDDREGLISVPIGMMAEEKGKAVIAGSPATTAKEILNEEGGIDNPLSATKIEPLQSDALAGTEASQISAPSEAENGSTSPASRKPHQGNESFQKKEVYDTSQNIAKDVNQIVLSSSSDQTEVTPEKLLNQPSLQKENQGSNQSISFNQTMDTLLGNARVESIDTVLNFSGEGTRRNGKSGEMKLADPKILLNSIVEEGTQIISKGGGRVKMTLNPPMLGSLDMDIRVRNNKVEVLFIADTPEIQQSLQANTDILKAALNQQGLKVEGYNVLLQGSMDSNPGSFSGQSALWRDQRNHYGKDQGGSDEIESPDTILTTDPIKRPVSSDSHKISLFI